jgi:RNA polymerase sigma-70 factor (ECF subfamily)
LLSDKDNLESAILVVRFQRGDRAAFEAIVRMWERRLFYYIRRLARSEEDAWELLQEAWLKLFRSLGSLRDPRTLPAYLYATARNTALSRLRDQKLQNVAESIDEVCDDSAAIDINAFDHAEEVHRALDQLPLAQREVLTLFFLQDLSLEEIAMLVGVPLGTVKSRLHYGKQAVRKIISGDKHVR